MADRYFLVLVVALTVVGSFWLSFVDPTAIYGIFLALLLSLLGLAAVANVASANKASILMPLFFIAAVAYEVYLYMSGRFGYLLISLLLLSLVGVILSFSILPRKNGLPKKAEKAPSAPSAKSPKRKAAKKGGSRRKK